MKLPVGYVGNGVVHQATAFGGLGQKLLEKHGWEKGQGLGKEKKGISKAIEVQKKEDQLGVGAELKPSWDWTKNFWADAFDSAATKVQGHAEDSDESSSDESSSSDEEEPAKKRKGGEPSMNRDGTVATASQAELKLAAELAKDPWGRWGGRGGKMARIREHEATEAKEKRESLGLPPAGSRANGSPSTSAPNQKNKDGSDLGNSKEAPKKRIVIVVSIKDDQRKERQRIKFKPTPKTGWWGATYFLSAGAMEGMEEEVEKEEKDHRSEGFKEADQEALYMLCHDHQRVGKRGLGKSTTLKIEGGNWEGSKTVFEDNDEPQPAKKRAKEGGKGKKIIKLVKDVLKTAPKHQMKIGKLFRLLEAQHNLDEETLKAGKKSVKRGNLEGLSWDVDDKRVKLT